MSKTWDNLKAEACARQRPLPIADACGGSGDIWATAQMWEYSSRQVWVVPCVSMQLGQKTNRTYLSNPSLTVQKQTHVCTQEQIKRVILNIQTPSGETCCHRAAYASVSLTVLLWNSRVATGGSERLHVLEDNLCWTIWSTFSCLFSGFPLFPKKRWTKKIFL